MDLQVRLATVIAVHESGMSSTNICAARAKQRMQYLSIHRFCSESPAQVTLYEANCPLDCTYRSVDFNGESVAVDNLTTPLGLQSHALIRFTDIVNLTIFLPDAIDIAT